MPAGGGGSASKADAETQAALDAQEAAGPWRIASSLGFDDVIDPRGLRNALLRALALTAARDAGPFAPVPRFGALP
jgi:acetyl-CoA carboxylase carboxyltransferase component